VVTVVLVVLIGGAGALVLPRLLHEAAPTVPSIVQAEVCLGVPPDGLGSAGKVRVTATRPGLTPFVVEEALPAAAKVDAVLGLLHAACEGTGWGDAAPRVNGTCLSFAGVTSVGGDPGTTQAPMSWSMCARPGQALAVRIRLTGGPSSEVEGSELRLALSGRGVVRDDAPLGAGAAAHVTRWLPAAAVLRGLAQTLGEADWEVEEEQDGALVVRSLPHTEALGSAILTVEYDAPADEAAAPPYEWTLELVR